jgi:PAS domain S-box-containing protein
MPGHAVIVAPMLDGRDADAPEGTEERTDALARALLEHGSDIVGIQDGTGRLLYINPVVERVLGYKGAQVPGRSVFDFIHPDDIAAVTAAQQNRLEAGGVGPGLEIRVRHADGSWRLLDVVSTNMLDDPEIRGVVFIARDVTERRATERALQERDAAFRLLAENSTDAIFRMSVDGTCLYASPSAEALLGYGHDELLGAPLDTLLAADPAPFLRAGELVRAGVDTFTLTYPVRCADGREIVIESTSRVIRDETTGDALEIQSAARDVSERMLSEARFQALVRHSTDIITVLDADGSWRSSSPAGTRLLGYEEGYNPEGGVLSLVHPDDIGAAAVALREVYEGTRGPDAPLVFRVRRIDGEYLMMETVGQNLIDDPSVQGVVLNSRDVTERLVTQAALQEQAVEIERLSMIRERERLELELERARRLESLGRLAGGVAHDMNTLIGVIMIYLNSLTAQLDADSPLHDDAEHIRAAIARAGDLTRQLLVYGRRGTPVAEVLDPDVLVEEVLSTVRATIDERVELVHSPTDEPVRVVMPRGQLEQVLLNVLFNACDATGDGGTVTVTTRNAKPGSDTVAALAPGTYVELTIEDTGVGMSPDVARAAFEPFFTTRSADGGTGLGLAIVQGFVDDAGGVVHLESKVGQGTVVTLVLPAGDGDALSESPARR